MDDNPNDTCWFFVDNSNVWIEAGKAAAARNDGSVHDPRSRYNIGEMVRILSKGRYQGPLSLYGSRPPESDTVWNAARKAQFNVHLFDRNVNNKEKEVDTMMATDIAWAASRLQTGTDYNIKSLMEEKANAIFVIISGDRDMVPAIKKALDADIRVELWAWETGMSKVYYQLDQDYSGRLTVHYLNEFYDDIVFIDAASTHRGHDPAKTVVCRAKDGELIDQKTVNKDLSRNLDDIEYFRRHKSETVLFVAFPKEKDIDPMIMRLRKLFEGRLSVISYPEYANSDKTATAVLETRNTFAPLGQKARPHTGPPLPEESKQGSTEFTTTSMNAQGASLHGDNGDWQPAKGRKPKRPQRQQGTGQRCPWKFNCRHAGSCRNQHTEDEERIFRDNPSQDMALWKTALCNRDKAGKCWYGKACPFAHKGEGFCRNCQVWGHVQETCKRK